MADIKYILKDYEVVEVDCSEKRGILEWALAYGKTEKIVGLYKDEQVTISTVFLGIEHGYRNGKPLVFETMIFKDGSEYWERCCTYDEAIETHQNAVNAHHELIKLREKN